MIYAVIDTNVLVSALLSQKAGAASVKIIDKVLAGEVTAAHCDGILREYQEVLYRDKFHFSRPAVDALIAYFAEYGCRVAPRPSGAVLPDADDQPFYDVAFCLRERGAYLVTCNLKHFPQEPRVVTPWDFLSKIQSQGTP